MVVTQEAMKKWNEMHDDVLLGKDRLDYINYYISVKVSEDIRNKAI